MTANQFAKAALCTGILVMIFLFGWEFYLRKSGVPIAFDDDKTLWAHKRAMVYKPKVDATVFVGSSRNKFDLDIATWEALTNDHPIQLAKEGSSPLPILDDLGKDKNFKGKLVIDVTEGIFFSTSAFSLKDPTEHVVYYKERTPAQQFSFHVNNILESNLVMLNKNYYSLNALFERLPLKKREGVFALPYGCPRDFGEVNFDRQTVMSQKFLADTGMQNQVKGLWDFYRKIDKEPQADVRKTDSIIATVKVAVDKIKSRGGQVIFVRSPSSGPIWAGEQQAFPREKFWEKLLTATATPGIHFNDFEAINHFICPEFSHLSQQDAVKYTTALVGILQDKYGWSFKKKS